MAIGDTKIMYFDYAGLTSKEELEVTSVSDKTVTLNDEWEFDIKTGECLNDNTFGGARRYIDAEV